MQHPRLIEDDYPITDAVVVGTFLNSLLRHGDRVTIACQAQLINTSSSRVQPDIAAVRDRAAAL
jgi:alpha-L-arabinofuranosidase